MIRWMLATIVCLFRGHRWIHLPGFGPDAERERAAGISGQRVFFCGRCHGIDFREPDR